MPIDHAEQLPAGRRKRRIDAIPATLRPPVASFEYFGVYRTEMYYKMLRDLVRHIGVRGGVSPLGRLIRVARESLPRPCGEADVPSAELPRWVTTKQAADYYHVKPALIRALIAHERHCQVNWWAW
jgi:hypothetical protein